MIHRIRRYLERPKRPPVTPNGREPKSVRNLLHDLTMAEHRYNRARRRLRIAESNGRDTTVFVEKIKTAQLNIRLLNKQIERARQQQRAGQHHHALARDCPNYD